MSHRSPKVRRFVPVLVALAASSPRLAGAETRTDCHRGDCEYRFDDADVNAPGPDPYGDVIKEHAGAPRVLLIRPRVSFVMTLLKTVEKF